ncbi:MAG: DJ-1 family protein, partial [Verrucomicrobia bacterium]
MSKKALIVLAPGFEEIEALTPIDILRRAKIEVTIASIEADKLVSGRNHISVQTDLALNELETDHFDAIIIPGGPGAKLLRKSPTVLE